MCCTAGLPMQIALNQLLVSSRPDRLLIEPTGLGHPKEVLQTLQGQFYRDAINVQQILTLVNARQLDDERYTENEIFNQQIAIADTVIGNKSDLYQPADRHRLQSYVETIGKDNAKVLFTTNGQLDFSLLDNKTDSSMPIDRYEAKHHNHESDDSPESFSEKPLPTCGYVKAEN